jgi:hypothetical protein
VQEEDVYRLDDAKNEPFLNAASGTVLWISCTYKIQKERTKKVGGRLKCRSYTGRKV